MAEDGPDINFDYFAIEDGWALAPLRVLLFDEYRRSIDSLGNPNLDKTPRDTVSLIAQFDRHMRAAQRRGDIVAIDHTKEAFAGGGLVEPLFRSQDLLKELKFRGYPVPGGLIEAIKEGDWPTVVELLKALHENMKVYVQSGGQIDKPELDKLTRDSKKKGSLPRLEDWKQVRFCALNKRGLDTYAAGKKVSIVELKNMGISKGKIGFLYNIALGGGFFDKASFPSDDNLNQSVNRLNKSLREAFQINRDPVTYNKKARGYQVSFQTK